MRLHAGEKDDRPGVVMRILADGERVMVLCGTRTYRPDLAHLKIEPQEPAGRALELYAPTYFYATGSVAFARASAVRTLGRLCPPDVFMALAELIGAG